MDGLKAEMSLFNGKEDMGKKAKNGLRGSQSSRLNCGFVEYLWGDVWEVFSGHNLFALKVMHSEIFFFLETAGNFHTQNYPFPP